MSGTKADRTVEREVAIAVGSRGAIGGTLRLPPQPVGVVLFAHGSGSSRRSPRNRFVAAALNQAAIATLLVDLLTSAEGAVDGQTARFRFDIDLLTSRVIAATSFVHREPRVAALPLGYFAASTGAAAALQAAAALPGEIAAIVSRGGRPDLAATALSAVRVPTLLIVGGHDPVVAELNERAAAQLSGTAEIRVVAGATHLFEEAGAMEEVARLACEWFTQRFARGTQASMPKG
jgi:putative phosphoribosyl transferase